MLSPGERGNRASGYWDGRCSRAGHSPGQPAAKPDDRRRAEYIFEKPVLRSNGQLGRFKIWGSRGAYRAKESLQQFSFCHILVTFLAEQKLTAFLSNHLWRMSL